MKFVETQPEDNRYNPRPLSVKDKVFDIIINSPTELISSEIHDKLPLVSFRQIRMALADLRQEDIVVTEECRCHKSVIYIGLETHE